MAGAHFPDQLLLIDVEGTDRSYAFGLAWFALVGSHAPSLARGRARRMRASHYVVGGLGAVAGGCARLAPRARSHSVHAAAQAFARLHPDGTAACVAPLPDGRWWLAAAQDGAVLARADRIYSNADEAQVAMQALSAQYPSLRQHDGPQALRTLMAAADAAALMLPVGSRWSRLPMPVRAFIAVLVAALAGPAGWQAWQRPSRALPPDPAPNVEAAWQHAVGQFREQQAVHGLPELGNVLASLHRLPLGVRGWLLQQARCLPGPRAWSCSASYVRAQPDATNHAFMQALPAGWQLQFRPLDGAELTWAVSGKGTSLAQVDPPPASHVDTIVASALQRARPAFSQLTLAAASPAPIAAPRDSQGRAIALPPAWPSLRQRTLALQGPLRSFALLTEQPLVVGWSSLVLRLAAGHAPTTTVSSLTAELQGVLYEQD